MPKPKKPKRKECVYYNDGTIEQVEPRDVAREARLEPIVDELSRLGFQESELWQEWRRIHNRLVTVERSKASPVIAVALFLALVALTLATCTAGSLRDTVQEGPAQLGQPEEASETMNKTRAERRALRAQGIDLTPPDTPLADASGGDARVGDLQAEIAALQEELSASAAHRQAQSAAFSSLVAKVQAVYGSDPFSDPNALYTAGDLAELACSALDDIAERIPGAADAGEADTGATETVSPEDPEAKLSDDY